MESLCVTAKRRIQQKVDKLRRKIREKEQNREKLMHNIELTVKTKPITEETDIELRQQL